MHYQQHGGVQCTQRVFSYMNVFSLHRMCSLYIEWVLSIQGACEALSATRNAHKECSLT
jgi:hypothetical protein